MNRGLKRSRSREDDGTQGDSDEEVDETPSKRRMMKSPPRKGPSMSSRSTLTVPSTATRTNSNNTLSSFRSAGSQTEASFTSVSRTTSADPSLLLLSRDPSRISSAPSLASRSSTGGDSDLVSDSSSSRGVKRPRSAMASQEGRTTRRPMAKARGVSMSRESSEDSSLRPKDKVGLAKRLTESDAIASESTMESSDNDTDIKSVKKRRRMGMVAPRLERGESDLPDVPEEGDTTIVPRRSTRSKPQPKFR
ncbi:hypothetical protein SCHPADRAFT_47887 [Schizopora paradoxa]|uniref:Uncharacterized protein n=1 Tax=Schizopora paradoxa TaxID=27342 RepID=A0A0H2SS72_9AGAM|nr:hypothetical protein SCHPADRAFT_47887 [Schizopora paradoxa]